MRPAMTQDAPDDPSLRLLFASARRLIRALEANADDTVLGDSVTAYVRCAAEQGFSRERIRLALDILVEEHASHDRLQLPSHGVASSKAALRLLTFVLGVADGVLTGRTRSAEGA
jgi:hypothetical protein